MLQQHEKRWVSAALCGTGVFPLHPSDQDRCVKPTLFSFFPMLSKKKKKKVEIAEENLHSSKPRAMNSSRKQQEGSRKPADPGCAGTVLSSRPIPL